MKIRIAALVLFLLIGVVVEPLTWGFSLHRYELIPTAVTSRGGFPSALAGQKWFLQAQGGQSYVFFSEDNRYVLKFFKDQPRPYLKYPSYVALKMKKLHRTLSGYSLIYDRCHDLSGLVCLHTQSSHPIPATLIDRIGMTHSVDLNDYLFVLQHKAEILERHDVKASAQSIIQALSTHHLTDHDPRLHKNLGTLDGHLIVIDPGRIVECHP